MLEINGLLCDALANSINTQTQGDFKIDGEIPTSEEGAFHGELATVLVLRSEKVDAILAVLITKELFLKLLSKMLGEEFTELNDELNASLAEFLNQAIGAITPTLKEKGVEFKTETSGVNSNFKLSQDDLGTTNCKITKFTGSEGFFKLGAILRYKEKPQAAAA